MFFKFSIDDTIAREIEKKHIDSYGESKVKVRKGKYLNCLT